MSHRTPPRRAPAGAATLLTLGLAASGVAGPDREPAVFRSGTELVVLDFVVRDEKGRLVTDLRPEEVQVLEDGKVCRPSEFQLVRDGRPVSSRDRAGSGPSQAGPRPLEGRALQPTLVVLAFDLLGPDSARRSREAALHFLERSFPADSWFGVLKVGTGQLELLGVTAVQSKTVAAIEAATRGAEQSREPATDGVSATLTEQALRAAAGAQKAAATASSSGDSELRLNQAFGAMLRFADRLDRERRGRSSIGPLLNLARGLRTLKGRKTLLYFSEGLHVPPALEGDFRTMVSEANRSNLAIYTFDARGLDERSPFAEARLALDVARGASLAATSESTPSIEGVRAADTASDALRLNVRGNLQDLAESTGGFLMADTNDLRSGLDGVAAELSSYYEIAYVPPVADADGRFHRTEVKLSRPGMTVRSRRGYQALPPDAPETLPWELALAQALAQDPPPRAFEHRAAALRFADADERTEVAILVDVPLRGIVVRRDEAAGVYRAHLQVLAHVGNEAGRVVARLSHDWPLEGPLAEAEAVKGESLQVRRSVRLAPGRYTLETAVLDGLADEHSVGRTTFEVEASSGHLDLGDVAVVRLEAAAATDAAGDPFHVGDVKATPLLGTAVPAGARTLSVLLTVHPGSAPEPVAVTLEFRREGKVVGHSTASLAPPDARGRVAYVGTLPAARFPPGRYELTVEATQGGETATRTAAFEISSASVAPPAAQAGPDAGLAELLRRAGEYVEAYDRVFRFVVAEELYRQWEPNSPSQGTQARTLRSDLVFVPLPGEIPWTTFRDVYEVDGQPVRERQARLERLFVRPSPDALMQADQILRESARYNLGDFYRTVNVPTLAMLFLHPRNQARFTFERKGARLLDGILGSEVQFREVARPTLVRDARGRDVPSRGKAWVDPTRGTILRIEATYDLPSDTGLATSELHQTASVSTEFRRETALDAYVPIEMTELYVGGAGRIEAKARYSKFRRFSVETDEAVSSVGVQQPSPEKP